MTVETYLNALSTERKDALLRISRVVYDCAPDATEGIGYGMPVFKYRGKYLIGMASFKNHLSIFPGPESIALMANELKQFKTAKGTVQFSAEKQIPELTLKKIILARIKQIDESLN